MAQRGLRALPASGFRPRNVTSDSWTPARRLSFQEISRALPPAIGSFVPTVRGRGRALLPRCPGGTARRRWRTGAVARSRHHAGGRRRPAPGQAQGRGPADGAGACQAGAGNRGHALLLPGARVPGMGVAEVPDHAAREGRLQDREGGRRHSHGVDRQVELRHRQAGDFAGLRRGWHSPGQQQARGGLQGPHGRAGPRPR